MTPIRQAFGTLPLAIRLALAKRGISLRELAAREPRTDLVWKRIAMTAGWEPRLRKAGKEWLATLQWRLFTRAERAWRLLGMGALAAMGYALPTLGKRAR